MRAIASRIIACLKGIATGDAIGKQTEGLSQPGIQKWYPQGIRGFEGPAGSTIPRYVGNRKREWRIGETTDDTERTIAVARAILRDRAVLHASVGSELLSCVKCVHPGVRSLWEFHLAGDPSRIANGHDGCGAAVRVAPVGILYASDRLGDIARGAWEASIATHKGPMAIAAAAATAAAVSAAIDGASSPDIVAVAFRTATLAERFVPGASEGMFASAAHHVHRRVSEMREIRPAELAACCFPDEPLTIVPLALALATTMDSAEAAILVAANTGGDSDSVASIAGGILGARHPTTVNDDWHAVVERVNGHELVSLARDLYTLRRRHVE